MIQENFVKKFELNNQSFDLHNQNMWLIASLKNEEVTRIELFGISLDDGIDKIEGILKGRFKKRDIKPVKIEKEE